MTIVRSPSAAAGQGQEKCARKVLACVLLLATTAAAQVIPAGTSDTAFPIPEANASFLPDLQTFLRGEDPARFAEQFQSFVVSGCLGSTSVTLSHTPTACLAYPGGYRTTETGHILYVDNSTCWAIVTSSNFGDVTGPGPVTFTRVPSTHYAINCTDPNQPATPPNAVLAMKVTTAGGAITAVADARVLSPVSLVTAGDQGAGNAVPDCLSGSKLCAGTVTGGDLAPGSGVRTAVSAAMAQNVSAINNEQTFVTLPSMTTSGGRVLILPFAVLSLQVNGTGFGTINLRWKRDGVAVDTVDVSVQEINTSATQFPLAIPPFTDAPVAGPHVYTFTAVSPNANILISSINTANRGSVTALELP